MHVDEIETLIPLVFEGNFLTASECSIESFMCNQASYIACTQFLADNFTRA